MSAKPATVADAASLTPPSPLELRDWLVEDHARYLRSRGVEPNAEALQALARHDLELVEAGERAGELKAPAAPSAPVLRPEDPAGEMAADMGYQLLRRDIQEEAKPRPKKKMVERHERLLKRCRALLAKYPGERALLGVWGGFLFPRFAKDLIEQQLQWKFHLRDYAGKTQHDRDRILLRRMEDIADRSTGALGPWWVK